jgi:hypothetical protein
MPHRRRVDAPENAAWQRARHGVARALRHRLSWYLRARSPQLLTLAFLAVAISWVTLTVPYDNGPAIRSDGMGYHAWTRAMLDLNFSFCRWRGHPEVALSVIDEQRNFCQNKYPPGLALMRFPIMAFLVDRSDPQRIGISPDEHFASLVIGGTLLWIQALLLLWTAALLRLRALRSCIAVLFCMFGTGLFHYGTYDSSFTHAYSAFFCTLLLFAAAREHATDRAPPAALLALAGFFLLALRNTNVFLLAALCAAYAIWRRPARAWWRIAHSLLPLALGAGAAIVFQLAYNSYAAGRFTLSSYGEEAFHWDRPMQLPVLFSYERGLFTYYPIFGVALVSALALPSTRRLSGLLLGLILIYMTIYGFWGSWMLGGGLGHRGFVELVPIVGVVLCLTWSQLPRPSFVASALVGLVCTCVTLQITFGYWRGTFHPDGETADNYWAHMHTLESFATGGTQCRPSRCEPGRFRCSAHDAPQFTYCVRNLTRPGTCFDGECAPVVMLRSLASSPLKNVASPESHRRRGEPLRLEEPRDDASHKYVMLADARDRTKVRFFSLATRRFVTAPQRRGRDLPLSAHARGAGDRETFRRRGGHRKFSLRASNDRFVSAVTIEPGRSQLVPSGERVDWNELFSLEYVRR